jgi:hypothetical protein
LSTRSMNGRNGSSATGVGSSRPRPRKWWRKVVWPKSSSARFPISGGLSRHASSAHVCLGDGAAIH